MLQISLMIFFFNLWSKHVRKEALSHHRGQVSYLWIKVFVFLHLSIVSCVMCAWKEQIGNKVGSLQGARWFTIRKKQHIQVQSFYCPPLFKNTWSTKCSFECYLCMLFVSSVLFVCKEELHQIFSHLSVMASSTADCFSFYSEASQLLRIIPFP